MSAHIHHVSIFVQEMQRSLQLFNGILGMPIMQQLEGVRGSSISTLLGIPDFRGDMVFLKHPDQQICLELVRQTKGTQGDNCGCCGFGISLTVPDLDEVHASLSQEGWNPLSLPLDMPDPSGRNVRLFCFRTEDGLMVEPIQQADEK